MEGENTQKLKIGIIGTGWVARMRHVPAWRRNESAELVAAYNPDGQLAKDFAEAQNIPVWHSDINKFLSGPMDAVSICSPPMNHFENAKAALLAGKHVLLEKPVTMTSQQAAELEELAKQKGKILCPAHNFLFCRAMKKAEQLLQEGKIGDITGAMGLQWSSHRRELPTWYKQLPGKLFFDESPHLLYLLDRFLKNTKVETAWYTEVPLKGGDETLERFEAKLKGENGWGLLSMWFGAPMSEWLVVVCGTKGAFVLDIFRDVLIYFPEEGKRTPQYLFEVILRADSQIWSQMTKWVISRFTKGSHLFGIDNLVNQFAAAIQGHGQPPLSAQDGRKVVTMIEDMLRMSGVK